MGEETYLGCTVPPPGWYCTRPAGHEGPCAAHPTYTPGASATPTERLVLRLICAAVIVGTIWMMW